MHEPTLILIPAVLAVIGWAFWGLQHEAGKIHGKLDEFMSRAKAAHTDEELDAIAVELIAYARKECWHREFGARVHAIHSYICGRRDA